MLYIFDNPQWAYVSPHRYTIEWANGSIKRIIFPGIAYREWHIRAGVPVKYVTDEGTHLVMIERTHYEGD